jgi:transcriptional regulator with XRE-family HTH domain
MRRLGLTQQEAAKRMGISISTDSSRPFMQCERYRL